jgi:hypothetical protein
MAKRLLILCTLWLAAGACSGRDHSALNGQGTHDAGSSTSGNGSGKADGGTAGSGANGSGANGGAAASGSGSTNGSGGSAAGSLADGGGSGGKTNGLNLCGGAPCQCADGIDNDGDGQIDGFDIDCTGANDNDESSFATGIPGDNVDPKWQDCFYDGNSGAGDDGCRYSTKCLTGELPPTDKDCTLSQQCIAFCAPRTPNGCDCFGCCTIRMPDGKDATIVLSAKCDPNDLSTCQTCTKSTACGNECSECELCPGKTAADLPASCAPSGGSGGTSGGSGGTSGGSGGATGGSGGATGGSGGATGGGTPYCANGTGCASQSDCPTNYYCSFGCCLIAAPE